MTTALVLSGGGTSAGFQVGALRYLYDVARIEPTVITGTSAGSILAALLAQGEGREEQRRILSSIELLIPQLRTGEDLLTPTDLLEHLLQAAPELSRLLNDPPGPESRTITVPGAEPTSPATSERPGRGGTPMRLPRPDTAPAARVLSLLWSARRSGTSPGGLVEAARRARSLFVPGPIVDRLLAPGLLDPVRLARSSTRLRVAAVALESGELRYITNTGTVVDRWGEPLGDDPVPIVDAVRASCAIPAVYPPVRLGREHYVDGGTRENVPVEMAMTHLGADRCFAVVALPTGLDREGDYADRDLVSIVVRSTTGIMADEVQLAGLRRAMELGATVIAPEVNLTGVLSVDPGLLAMATDYGYIRAAEAVEQAPSGEVELTHRLVRARQQAWREECRLRDAFGEGMGASPADRAELGRLKREVRDLAARVPAARMPSSASEWGRSWELHAWPAPALPAWSG